IRDVEVAHKRTLGVVEMPALGLDGFPCLARIFFFPLGYDVEVGPNFEKVLENERKALGRGFLQGQNLYVEVVEAKMPAVAFEVGFAEIIVEERVVLQVSALEFDRREVQGTFENS